MTPVLLACNISLLSAPELYNAALSAVYPARREKVLRLRIEQDRMRSLGAGLLLQRALRELGCDDDLSRLQIGEHGKPYLPGGPCFSLSHSGEWATCAAGERELGCDVEELRPVRPELFRRLHPAEYTDILSLPEAAREERFFRYWTLKESFMKVTGLGLALPLESFRIRLGDRVSVEQHLNHNEYAFFEYTGLPGCKCALCSEGESSAPALRLLSAEELIGALL